MGGRRLDALTAARDVPDRADARAGLTDRPGVTRKSAGSTVLAVALDVDAGAVARHLTAATGVVSSTPRALRTAERQEN